VNGPYGDEHEHSAGSSAWMWVIDPIDGTASFALGHLHWATLIGLNDGTGPCSGWRINPSLENSS
jgi:myo-inositol-1(or 4)-monophosphatase